VGRLARPAGFFEVEIWHYDCINRESLIPLFEATDPLVPQLGKDEG
jgi:hypothetical protein